MATAISVVVVALIVVINFVAGSLTNRYSLTLDLTPGKLFSITGETKQYLADLDKDVVIQVLDTEESFTGRGEYYLQAMEVLKKFALESPRITIQHVDLVSNPTFAQSYPDLQLSSSSILITSRGKTRDVTPYDLYNIESDQYGGGRVTASKAEQVLTSAILGVTSDKTINVAVIEGHNEENISSFTNLLISNNYTVETKSILTEEIDPAFTVAIIAAPQRDYTDEELKKLDRFLKNGGKYGKTLLYLSPSEQTEQPALAAFLADWGIEVGMGMVFETDPARFYPNEPFMALVDYGEDEFSANAQAAKMTALTAYSRPVSLLFESKSSITTSTLLQFGSTAGIAISNDNITENAGPVPHLVMARSMTYDGTTPLQSQVLVAGSSALINQQFTGNPNLANSSYLLDLLASLSGKEDSISIQSKNIGAATLSITQGQALVTGLLLAIVFPLAVLIFGIVVWARRRHR